MSALPNGSLTVALIFNVSVRENSDLMVSVVSVKAILSMLITVFAGNSI